MKKLRIVLLSVMVAVMILPTLVAAATPYGTYTYSSEGKMLASPTAYVPDMIIDSMYMGLDVAIDEPRDIEVGPDGKLYIADTVNNRIIVCDRYYKFQFEIKEFVNEFGVPDSFNKPSGVFVNEEFIYVCDTDHDRIVKFDLEGNYVRIIKRPESNLFEDGDFYKPVAVAVDQYGRLFVVSSATYQGIIVINDDSEFFGFIGATKTVGSVMETLFSAFLTDEQKENRQENVSTEFNNITIDDQNFVYVTTSSIDAKQMEDAITSKSKSGDFAPVRKLNANGVDVLKRNGFYPPSGEVAFSTLSTATIKGASSIVDVAIGPEGTWSIIDSKRSKIYTYDENGNLLFAFGDLGNQTGNIELIGGITYQGDKILALDKANDNIVVFRRTEYGDLLMTALKNNNDRKYDLAVNDWTEVLKRNNNFDSSYVQIGRSLFRQAKYEEAMEYYKASYEVQSYSEAYSEIRKEWASTYFWMIPVLIVVIFLLVLKFMGYTNKVNTRAALKVGRNTLTEELLYAFHVIFHPFDGFWDLKHEKRGSIRSALTLMIVTVIVYFYNSIGQGWIFNPHISYANVFGAVTAVIAPLLLWVIANWCLTTLFEGEGTMSDIFIACCYCLTPLILLVFPSTLLSNVLLLSEGSLLTLLNTLAYIWMGILLIIAMMSTHDYTLGKNILTCVSTIVGMAFLMFLGILFTTLVGKIVMFIIQIV
ncbi:MAG: YIP1 family protein, partial [Firmicutes bacterium]|nr:YIP1 family protein [Bacillota bacterium]